ncbi:hypothetical protein BGX30_004492, partial [Mortierella sp. GBA39]
MSRTAVSKHLRILSEAGLVKERKVGRETRYRLDPGPLQELKDWYSYFERFWENKMAALQHFVESDGSERFPAPLTFSRFTYEGGNTMSVHFLVGRSGSGKTTAILSEITSRLQAEPKGSPLILLVPEQGSFQAEHSLVSSGAVKGSVRAQVLSFRRLAYRVMQETGGSARVGISEEGKKMLLYKIIQRRKEELKLFGASGDQLGFIGKLNELYTELKRYCVDSAVLEEHLTQLTEQKAAAPILRYKLEDLWTVYRDFEQEISPLYIDDEDTLVTLAEGIRRSSYVKGADVWIDGFHGMTPQEYGVVRELMAHASSVTIALTLDKPYHGSMQPHELDLFHPTATTYIKLRGMADELGIETNDSILPASDLPKFRLSPRLAHLERGYDRRIPWKGQEKDQVQETEGISLYAAENRRTEHLVEPLFRDYGIPFFLDQKRSELHHPLVEFIRSALDVVRRNWRHEDVFRCIKSDLLLPLDGSLGREDMDVLENYALACGIQGYRWTDGRPWKAVPSLSLEENGNDRRKSGEQLLSLMEHCRRVVSEPLLAFGKRVKKAGSAEELSTAVFRLLEEADIPEKLDLWSREALESGRPEAAREHRQLWDAVLELLDQIVEMM